MANRSFALAAARQSPLFRQAGRSTSKTPGRVARGWMRTTSWRLYNNVITGWTAPVYFVYGSPFNRFRSDVRLIASCERFFVRRCAIASLCVRQTRLRQHAASANTGVETSNFSVPRLLIRGTPQCLLSVGRARELRSPRALPRNVCQGQARRASCVPRESSRMVCLCESDGARRGVALRYADRRVGRAQSSPKRLRATRRTWCVRPIVRAARYATGARPGSLQPKQAVGSRPRHSTKRCLRAPKRADADVYCKGGFETKCQAKRIERCFGRSCKSACAPCGSN